MKITYEAISNLLGVKKWNLKDLPEIVKIIKPYLTADEIYYAESVISRDINILEENKNLLGDLKNNLNEILTKNKIHPFTGKLLLIKSKKK